MAIAITQRISENSGTTSQGSRTTGSFTPAANSRLFVFAAGQRDGHTTARNWTISGGSLTWTALDESTLYQWGALGGLPSEDFHFNVKAWYADIGGSPSSMTVTVDASAGNEFYAVIAFDITGHNTSGPFPQGSVDNGANYNPESNSASLTLTLGSNPASANHVVAMFGAGADSGGGFATPTGYTALTNQNQAYCQAAVFYRTGTTTPGVTCSDLGQAVGNSGGIVFEIAVSGGVSVSPAAAAAVAVTINPTVILGSLALTPTPASAVAVTVNPTIVLGSLTLTPSQAAAIAGTVDPTVILGSLSLTPTAAIAIATTVDPTVDAGGSVQVTPAPASTVATTIDPTVILGSLALTPTAVAAVGLTIDPTVSTETFTGIIAYDLPTRSFAYDLEDDRLAVELPARSFAYELEALP